MAGCLRAAARCGLPATARGSPLRSARAWLPSPSGRRGSAPERFSLTYLSLGERLVSQQRLLLGRLLAGDLDGSVESGAGHSERHRPETGAERRGFGESGRAAALAGRLGFDKTSAGGDEVILDLETEAAGAAEAVHLPDVDEGDFLLGDGECSRLIVDTAYGDDPVACREPLLKFQRPVSK